MKNGAPRDELQNGRGRGWAVPYFLRTFYKALHERCHDCKVTLQKESRDRKRGLLEEGCNLLRPLQNTRPL